MLSEGQLERLKEARKLELLYKDSPTSRAGFLGRTWSLLSMSWNGMVIDDVEIRSLECLGQNHVVLRADWFLLYSSISALQHLDEIRGSPELKAESF